MTIIRPKIQLLDEEHKARILLEAKSILDLYLELKIMEHLLHEKNSNKSHR